MSPTLLAWSAVTLYALLTAGVAWRAARRTGSMKAFAVGSGHLSPWLVGLSLAAQLTSVATFVVNPGLVFAYGLSGLLGLGVAAAGGITVGLLLFSTAFRRVGAEIKALTVPQWIGTRHRSPRLAQAFAVLSLALVSYAVLIVVALSWVLHLLLGPPAWLLAGGLILLVFGTVAVGGANAHAWTNAAQASLMLVVALVLLVTGLPTLWSGEGLFTALAAQDPALVTVTNPASPYFRTLFEVFAANFLVGLAIVCQPHVLSKALYVKSDREVRHYLAVAIAVGMVFMMVLWVGLFARLQIPATTPIDQVVPTWLSMNFGPVMRVFISLGLLAAGVSTLEGIVLAVSSSVSLDLVLPLLRGRVAADDQSRVALRAGRWAIVAFAFATWGLSILQIANPTGGSVAIFAQYGVYALVTVSFVPIATGVLLRNPAPNAVLAGTGAALLAYLGVAVFEPIPFANNPAILATCGIVAGWTVFGLATLLKGAVAVARPASRPAVASRS